MRECMQSFLRPYPTRQRTQIEAELLFFFFDTVRNESVQAFAGDADASGAGAQAVESACLDKLVDAFFAQAKSAGGRSYGHEI